jgi:hypothetical protein
MLVAEIIDKANLRAKALAVGRNGWLYEPKCAGLNGLDSREDRVIASKDLSARLRLC